MGGIWEGVTRYGYAEPPVLHRSSTPVCWVVQAISEGELLPRLLVEVFLVKKEFGEPRSTETYYDFFCLNEIAFVDFAVADY